MRIVPSLQALAAVASLGGVALPAEAVLRGGGSVGGGATVGLPGRSIVEGTAAGRKLKHHTDIECEFEIDSNNFFTTEKQVRAWKNCTEVAMGAARGASRRALGHNHDEPVLISQDFCPPGEEGGRRRLGKRKSTCRRCNDRRRRLDESDDIYEETMCQCLNDNLDDFLCQSFKLKECYEVEDDHDTEDYTIGDGAEEEHAHCETKLLNNGGRFLDGEEAMWTFDHCFAEMYNCYHSSMQLQVQTLEITAQRSPFLSSGGHAQGGGHLRHLMGSEGAGNEYTVVEATKQTCSSSRNSIEIEGIDTCTNDDFHRRLRRTECDLDDFKSDRCYLSDRGCTALTGYFNQQETAASLEDWIGWCLTSRVPAVPVFPPTMTVDVTCTEPVMTESQFNSNLEIFEENLKVKHDQEMDELKHAQKMEDQAFKNVKGEMERDYHLNKITQCGKLLRTICHEHHWKAALHVLDVNSNGDKFKAGLRPERCRELEDTGIPKLGMKDEKQGFIARVAKEYEGLEIKEHECEKKVDKCENDWDIGDVKCSEISKTSQIEFFVFVGGMAEDDTNPDNYMPDKDDFCGNEYQNINATLEAYDADSFPKTKPLGDYCYFLYEVDCDCGYQST